MKRRKTKTRKRETKKPKGFKPGSSKGWKVQCFSDKIKKAHEKGSAWLTYHYSGFKPKKSRLKIMPSVLKNVPKDNHGYIKVLARCRWGIDLFTVHNYNSNHKVVWTGNSMRYIEGKNILALVVEEHCIRD